MLAGGAAWGQGAETRPPNFVVILADDLGYGDVGCYGSTTIRTPRIDRMAAEGVRFNDFYAAAVCTPSRASLLTGCYAARVGLAAGVLFPHAQLGLNPAEVTVAEVLKAKGYATSCIGKWHVGDAPAFLPTHQGFDEYYGIPYSNDMRIRRGDKVGPPILRGEEVVEHPADQDMLTEHYTREAVKFIDQHRQSPFFLYLAHAWPHVPLYASGRFRGKSAGGLYGDTVESVDWSVGEVLDALKRNGLDENTLVVFLSDNGPMIEPPGGGSAGPLRGKKAQIWEGSLRVPCVVRWPGHVPAGRLCSEVATEMDILPTFAGLAGARVPEDRVIDGHDAWPLMSGQQGAKSGYEAFFYYHGIGVLGAVRSGDWKMIVPFTLKVGPVPRQLFNLRDDIGETHDVQDQHRDVVKRLEKLVEQHREDLRKNSRPIGRVEGDGVSAAGANDD